MKPIHLREDSQKFRSYAIHFIQLADDQLTDDPAKVTCKICLKMMARRKKAAL